MILLLSPKVLSMADIFLCPACYMRKVHKIRLKWDEEPHSYDEQLPACSECKRPRSATLRADKNVAFYSRAKGFRKGIMK